MQNNKTGWYGGEGRSFLIAKRINEISSDKTLEGLSLGVFNFPL